MSAKNVYKGLRRTQWVCREQDPEGSRRPIVASPQRMQRVDAERDPEGNRCCLIFASLLEEEHLA